MPVSLKIYENDDGPNNINVGLTGGEKGYVITSPVNPLFSFKVNGIGTYNTDYLLPLYVDTLGAISLSNGTNYAYLDYGFDSLALGATVTDTFQVEYTTGENQLTKWVTITVEGLNDDPTAVDDRFGVIDNDSTGVRLDVLLNDFDIDTFDNETTNDDDFFGDGYFYYDAIAEWNVYSLNITSVTQGTEGGTVSHDGQSVTYVPLAGFIGVDTFTYTIADPWGGLDTATVSVVVGPTNTAPVAADDSYSVDEDDGSTPFAAPGVLANDTDADGDTLGTRLLSGLYYSLADGTSTTNSAAGGTGTLSFSADGSFTYNPGGNFNYLALGESAYVAADYRAFDGEYNSYSDATFVIEIKGENDAPVAVEPDVQNVYEAGLSSGGSGVGDTTIIVSDSIVVTDPDTTDTHFISKVDGVDVPASGVIVGVGYTLTISGLTYTYELTDNRTTHTVGGRTADGIKNEFVLTISDDNGADSLTDTVTLTVNIFDDQPVIATDFSVGSISHDETQSHAGTLFSTQTDIISGLGGPSGAVTPGADGIQSQTITLTDSGGSAFNGTATNLIDMATGNLIFLYNSGGGKIQGLVGTSDNAATGANSSGKIAFEFELTNPDLDSADGKLTLNRPLDHLDDSDPNDSLTLTAYDGSALVHVTVTVDDGDTNNTDTVSATSASALGISFFDDAPALTSIESGYVEFAAGTSEGVSDRDFGFDGAGEVELVSATGSVAVKDIFGVTRFTLTADVTPSDDDSTSDNTVTYSSAGGLDYFQFILDPESGNYTFEVLRDPPAVSNPVNFDSVQAGSPEGTYIFATDTGTLVGFSAYDEVPDDGDNYHDLPNTVPVTNGDVKDAIEDGDPTATVNPSNQGFGANSNNTDPGEAYVIKTLEGDGTTAKETSGVEFDVGKATGGIGEVSFQWEAYDSGGNLVAEGTETLTSVPKPGATDVPVKIALDPGVTASTYYILPTIENDKGAFAITKVSILEPVALGDFIFNFGAIARDADGDETAEVNFQIGVDGSGNGWDLSPTLTELDPVPDPVLAALLEGDTFDFG